MCDAIQLLTTKDCERLAENIIENIDGASALLKLIANEKQVIILCWLMEDEKSVTELETMLELSQWVLPQYLARLRAVKIAKTRRVAQTILYKLNDGGAETILAALHFI